MPARVYRKLVIRFSLAIAAFSAVMVAVEPIFAQTLVARDRSRNLAPDALEVIDPDPQPGETAQGPVDLPLIAKHPELVWQPNFEPISETLVEKSKKVVFRGEVYCLEFAFKPMRMIQVGDKLVWYMLYRVRYMGGDLQPKPDKDSYDNEIFVYPQAVSTKNGIVFIPTFVLESLSSKQKYLDQILPQAKALIAQRERVGQPIYDSSEIQKLRIKKTTEAEDNSVWGVATWQDVDPRTDFFTVLVRGLTNAQKLITGGDKLEYQQKLLLLRFSRPGDTINETEDIIRFGVPAMEDPSRQKYVLDKYGIKERLDYEWVYR